MTPTTPTPGVEVTLADGKKHHLRFDNRALVTLERETGKTLGQLALSLSNGSFYSATAVVWAGLLHEKNGNDQPLMFDEVVDLIDPKEFKRIADKAGDAINIALGDEPEDDKGN